MIVRLFFFATAVLIAGAGAWAYHHDQKLQHSALLVNLGDPNETVRQIMGDPSREAECGSLTLVPQSCADEYVYRFYYSLFRPRYEVVWFDKSGKVIGMQYVQKP
jgi:hypothetical protein